MIFEDVKLDFAGFLPSPSVFGQLKSVAYDVLMDAPSDSFTRATIRKMRGSTGEVFEGVLRITSSVGVFFAKESDTDVVRLMERLRDGMMGKLTHWKLGRFDGEHSDNLHMERPSN